MAYDWVYAKLKNGRLVDEHTGADINPNFPYFSSVQEAESYLVANDVRVTVTGVLSSVTPRYPEHIMQAVRYNHFNIESDDTSQDMYINEMSGSEVFDSVLEYEGIIGYAGTIRRLVYDIYGVDLESMY